jgi:hypothetical protein
MNVALAVTAPVSTTAIVLTQQPGNGNNGGQGEDFGKSSPVGFLLLLIFLIAVALLVRSMTKHLKRIPASFDGEEHAEDGKGVGRRDDTDVVEEPAGPARVSMEEKQKSSG